MGIKNAYIAELKERTGFSWAELEDKTGYPQTTLRDHLTGRVARPNPEILASVVEAMGGDVGKVAEFPASIRREIADVQRVESVSTEEQRLTIETMRKLRGEMMELQRVSYEREIERLEASNKFLRSALFAAISAILVILVFIIGILIYDLTHLDRGWVQAFYNHSTWKSIFDAFLAYMIGG